MSKSSAVLADPWPRSPWTPTSITKVRGGIEVTGRDQLADPDLVGDIREDRPKARA
jgi:hypothetical protein